MLVLLPNKETAAFAKMREWDSQGTGSLSGVLGQRPNRSLS